MSDATYSPAKTKPPASLLDFAEYLAPVLKYYLLLLVVYLVAKRINRALDEESQLQEKEYIRERPNLSTELMQESSSEEEESEEEEEDEDEDNVDEELFTDGPRLVKVPGAGETEVRERKGKKKDGAAKELFEGLQKIEKELREDAKQGKEASVSWNELHAGMLHRYKDKFPDKGLRVAGADDDYDDEFKELLKKHNIKPEDFKMNGTGVDAVDGSGKNKTE